MGKWLKRCRFGVVTAIILVLFTSYALLDVFVIPHEYSDVGVTSNTNSTSKKNNTSSANNSGSGESGNNSNVNDGSGNNGDNGGNTDNGNGGLLGSGNGNGSGSGDDNGNNGGLLGDGRTFDEPEITDNSYRDNDIAITISQYRVSDTDVYVADVRVSSPEYLFSAFAKDKYGRNVTETTSAIASRADAILAVNGDYYGARNSGYVIRNGVLYRSRGSNDEALVMYEDGTLATVRESDVSAEQLLNDGAVQVWSFGPGLLTDGEITVSAGQEVGRAMASNPRTALAYVEDNHYLFVVADGRTGDSDGLSLLELATFLQSLGAKDAYNLDGGGSSTMVFLGKVVNNPTTNGRKVSERSVSDIVCIGYEKS
ncbi:MAG: phosphodiester glycosidase family protein [Lachnospiraceae bacterium]|nr:phosphodiester glycosidase family protein [Lachnospiraceae bacterium]